MYFESSSSTVAVILAIRVSNKCRTGLNSVELVLTIELIRVTNADDPPYSRESRSHIELCFRALANRFNYTELKCLEYNGDGYNMHEQTYLCCLVNKQGVKLSTQSIPKKTRPSNV